MTEGKPKREKPDNGRSDPIRGGDLESSGKFQKNIGAHIGFRRVYKNLKTGQEYIRVREIAHGPGQELFSKILARFMPASITQEMTLKRRILPDKKIYASHITPLKETRPLSAAEIEANAVLMQYIFKCNDVGRPGLLEHNMHTKRAGPSGERHVAVFDFENMAKYFMEPSIVLRFDDPFLKAKYWRRAALGPRPAQTTSITDWVLETCKPEVQEAVIRQLREMKKIFDNEEGQKYVQTIAKSIGLPMEKVLYFPDKIVATCKATGSPDECLADAFHATLVTRINDSLKGAEKIQKKKAA